MENKKMEHFKRKLISERERINSLIEQLKENRAINFNEEMTSELSFYDNHPGDGASTIYDMERGMAFKEHENTIIKKIDDALANIENGSYGKCHKCGKDIPEERLEFIPYTEYCVSCQEAINSIKPAEKNDRPVEEEVLGYPFGYGFTDFDYDENVEYDAEDSYQDVWRFERRKNVVETYEDDETEGFVEPVEKISNDQYKNQLPD